MTQDVTDILVKEFVKHKKALMQDHIPLSVWKETASVLEDSGHTYITWEICREKYNVMDTFFKKLLASNGMLCGNKWRHYDNFLELNTCTDECNSK